MSDGREPRFDEEQRVEDELTALLRDGYGVHRGDLTLTPEQQRVSDHNAAELLARIAGAPSTGAPSTGASPTRASSTRGPGAHSRLARRSVLGAGIAAAVAAAVALAVIVVPPGSTPPAAHAGTPPLLEIENVDPASYPLAGAPADAELGQLALSAAAQPVLTGSGPIHRVESSAWWLSTEGAATAARTDLVPVDVQRFLLPEGRVRIREQRGEPITGRGAIAAAGDRSATTDDTFPVDTANPLENPALLPTRVAPLRAALLGPDPSECAGIEAYCLTRAIQSLNLGFVLAPDLQAGLLRSLRGADDIGYAGRGRDRVGRTVEVFVVADPDGVHQHLVLFDAGTGAWVGDETVLTRPSADIDVEPPAVVEFNAITDRALISPDRLPPRPTDAAPAE